MKLLCGVLVALGLMAPAGAAEELAQRYRAADGEETGGAHWQRALELYSQGPDAAPQILAELDLEIADNPKTLQARILKARVLKGTDQCKEAIAVLDDADEIAEKGEFISGGAKFLRAECLYYEKQYTEAKQILTAYWAFMNGSPSAKKKYEELDARVDKALSAGASSSGQKS